MHHRPHMEHSEAMESEAMDYLDRRRQIEIAELYYNIADLKDMAILLFEWWAQLPGQPSTDLREATASILYNILINEAHFIDKLEELKS